MRSNKLIVFLGCPLIFIIVCCFNDVLHKLTGLSYPGDVGVFGDQFGTLNTLFSGLAFVVLYTNLRQQNKALEQQNIALKQQNIALEKQENQIQQQRRDMENQSKLMKIQIFESLFFKQLEYMDYLCKNIRIDGKKGIDAVSEIEKSIKECLEIIKNPILSESRFSSYENGKIEINKKWCIFEDSYDNLRPWVNKFYSLINQVDEIDFLEEKEKCVYLKTILETLFDKQKYVLQIMGMISSNELQRSIEEKLRKRKDFHMNPNSIF